MEYNQQQTNNHYPPDHCNYGTMCNQKPEVVNVEVRKVSSGKSKITTFGQVCVKTGVGNVTNELSVDYEFVRWYAWCGDCFMLHNDKQREVENEIRK